MNIGAFIVLIIAIYFLVFINIDTWIGVRRIEKALNEKVENTIPLDKVKQTREKISDWDVNKVMDGCSEPFRLGVARGLDIASEILDKLIESEEEK